MKGKVVLSVLAVIGILALSATAAQAGAGGSAVRNHLLLRVPRNQRGRPGAVVDVEVSVFGSEPAERQDR